MSLTAGLAKVCVAHSGGVSQIHLANVEDVASFTLVSEEYTTAVMVSSAVFFKFEFEQDTAERRENGTVSEGGSLAFVHEIEFFIGKLSTVNRTALAEIADQSVCGMIAIVTDANATDWVVGYSENNLLSRPLRLATDASLSGKAFTDLSGSTLTLTATDNEKARVFTGTIPV